MLPWASMRSHLKTCEVDRFVSQSQGLSSKIQEIALSSAQTLRGMTACSPYTPQDRPCFFCWTCIGADAFPSFYRCLKVGWLSARRLALRNCVGWMIEVKEDIWLRGVTDNSGTVHVSAIHDFDFLTGQTI